MYKSLCTFFFFKAKSGRCIMHLERKAVVFVKVSVCLSFSKAWEIVEFRLGPLSEGKLVSPCFLEDELRWFAREPFAKLGEETDPESAGQDHQLGDLPVSWVTFQIRGSDHGNSLSSILYCMKLYCREWRGSVGFLLLLSFCVFFVVVVWIWCWSFIFWACVVEEMHFDIQCLLDFLRHWSLYGISQTSVCAVVQLRDGKGTHAKTQSAGWSGTSKLLGSLNCAVPLKLQANVTTCGCVCRVRDEWNILKMHSAAQFAFLV